jgi:hypothetical protein
MRSHRCGSQTSHQPLRSASEIGPEQPASDPVFVGAAAAQSDAQVAFDAPTTSSPGNGGGYPEGDRYGGRVSPAGAVLDRDGFLIASGPGDQSSADIAFDGTNYLVT